MRRIESRKGAKGGLWGKLTPQKEVFHSATSKKGGEPQGGGKSS